MLKYVDTKVVFAEVPDEITLAINISNCPCHCEGCHSSYLANDIGTPLNGGSLEKLLRANKGISCVAFMGGDACPDEISCLSGFVKQAGLKAAWYSGRQQLPHGFPVECMDYVKLGPYRKDCGALDNPSTNQRFYKIGTGGMMTDITHVFWRGRAAVL